MSQSEPTLAPAPRALLSPRLALLTAMVLAAALARLLEHWPNFTPVGAMALFGGACFADRRAALLVPLAAMLLSDWLIGFHSAMPVVYGCFAVNVLLGRWLARGRSIAPTAVACLAGSVLFFLATNFAVWALGSSYPKTGDGLLTCYVAGLPFFRYTLMGDAFYTAVLFGGLWALERVFPILRQPALVASTS